MNVNTNAGGVEDVMSMGPENISVNINVNSEESFHDHLMPQTPTSQPEGEIPSCSRPSKSRRLGTIPENDYLLEKIRMITDALNIMVSAKHVSSTQLYEEISYLSLTEDKKITNLYLSFERIKHRVWFLELSS